MKIYIVQNQEGKYFRNIGYGGRGQSWREKLEEARLYSKLGPARAQVTFWYKTYPTYGCPRILVFTLGVENAEVMEMKEETEKSVKKIEKKKLQQEIRRLENKSSSYSQEKHSLQAKLEEVNAKLKTLKG